MTSGSSNWTWPEIEPLAVLLATAASEPILCGGQAVGFWAARFHLGAIVSRDLDWRAVVPVETISEVAASNTLVSRFLSGHWPRLAAEGSA